MTEPLPRCPAPACPVRWRSGGPDRLCSDHAEDDATRVADRYKATWSAVVAVSAARA